MSVGANPQKKHSPNQSCWAKLLLLAPDNSSSLCNVISNGSWVTTLLLGIPETGLTLVPWLWWEQQGAQKCMPTWGTGIERSSGTSLTVYSFCNGRWAGCSRHVCSTPHSSLYEQSGDIWSFTSSAVMQQKRKSLLFPWQLLRRALAGARQKDAASPTASDFSKSLSKESTCSHASPKPLLVIHIRDCNEHIT